MEAHAHAVHPPTTTGIHTWKLGFWTFLGSETLFFGSFISSYLIYAGRSVAGPYPGDVINIPLTSVSTFVLLMSSLAMVLALANVQRGNRKWGFIFLLVTAALGLTFLGFQAFEFTHFYHEGLTLSKNVFGSSFFILTGFHGAHVSIGVISAAPPRPPDLRRPDRPRGLAQGRGRGALLALRRHRVDRHLHARLPDPLTLTAPEAPMVHADVESRSHADPHEENHPGWTTYVVVALILTAITALEVSVFYIPALHPVLVPTLVTLSAVKFALVVMFYMHLKMDSRIFTGVFAAPLALALFLVIALVVLFKVLPAHFG